MNERDFAYWLQGFVEMNPEMKQPTPEQWAQIKDHLKLVFTKVTPNLPRLGERPFDSIPPFTPQWVPGGPIYPNPIDPYKVTCEYDFTRLKTTTLC